MTAGAASYSLALNPAASYTLRMIPNQTQPRHLPSRHLLARPVLLALFAPLALLATAPVEARARQASAQPPADASALPPLPDQSAPWLYRGADVPQDREWKFGTLPN
ncbi:MAG TPA: hypothetical protein VII48_04280, partial [Rhizomicrobium sp.]